MSVLNAAGICRRRGTPSFWRRTSQCAFAVRGEMPSRSPTSSFEQPNAINSTTWRCRWVSETSVPLEVLFMDATLRRKSHANHRLIGVFDRF